MSHVPLATPADRGGSRLRLLPPPRQLLAAVLVALVTAGALMPYAHNPYIELVGETLFISVMLLIAFTLAGAWRQPWLPRWSVQVAAVVLAAVLSPLLVQLLTFGGDFIAFIGSRHHVRGYILVSIGAGVLGVLFALGGLYRERDCAELHCFRGSASVIPDSIRDPYLSLPIPWHGRRPGWGVLRSRSRASSRGQRRYCIK